MNRTYRPDSKTANAVAAVAAVLLSLLVMNAIDGLAEHYHTGTHVAQATSSARAA